FPVNPNVVKVVVDQRGNALYFSRAMVPFERDRRSKTGGHEARPYRATGGLHVGIYAYRADFLQKLAKLRPTPLELTEKLEQLRVLENGYDIAVGLTRLASH